MSAVSRVSCPAPACSLCVHASARPVAFRCRGVRLHPTSCAPCQRTSSVQARLVKIVAKTDLDIPLDELEQRLETVMVLMPDLGTRLHGLHENSSVLLAVECRACL